MFKYMYVFLCITENSAEGGKTLKFNNKQCRVTRMGNTPISVCWEVDGHLPRQLPLLPW